MIFEEKAGFAFNLKTPWPSSVGSTLRKADAYSKVIRAGRGRGKDRAGAQRSSSMPTTVASPARRTTIPGTSQPRKRLTQSVGISRGSIRSGGHCAGVVARWLVGEVVEEKSSERRAREKEKSVVWVCRVHASLVWVRPFQ